MPQSEPVTILIVNKNAEDIKLVTISLRGFFPDCRIDVAYSAEEATAFASSTTQGWAVLLLDEMSLTDAPMSFVENLRRRAPYAAILLRGRSSPGPRSRPALS
jgi:hypothetical protein